MAKPGMKKPAKPMKKKK